MACVTNGLPEEDRGVEFGGLRTTTDMIKAVTDEVASQIGVDPNVLKGSPIGTLAMNIVELHIADSQAEAVGNLTASALGAQVLAMMFPGKRFVMGVAGAFGGGTVFTASKDLRDCAVDGLKDLADTMNSNPDLNLTPSLPPWWNNLRDRFNDATDTPDPILTLRRLGAWGGDPLILDLNGDGVDLVQLADSTARFDLNANDFVTPTGWVNANDGLLVLDQNHLEMQSYKAA